MRQFFSRRPDPLYNGEAIVFKNPSLVHSGKCAASVHSPTSTIISSVGKWGVGLSKKGRQGGIVEVEARRDEACMYVVEIGTGQGV